MLLLLLLLCCHHVLEKLYVPRCLHTLVNAGVFMSRFFSSTIEKDDLIVVAYKVVLSNAILRAVGLAYIRHRITRMQKHEKDFQKLVSTNETVLSILSTVTTTCIGLGINSSIHLSKDLFKTI